MPIVGNGDERIRILNFDDNNEVVNKPLPSITAIDTRFIGDPQNSLPDFGTGIVISPNFVLTAAHVIYLRAPFNQFQNNIRVSSSNNQKDLNNRAVGINNIDPGTNVNINSLYIPFFDDYVAAEPGTDNENRFDIGLIELNNTDLISDAPPVGLTAFVAPRTVRELGIPIQTAGYAGDNVANSFPTDNPNNNGIPDRNGNIRPRAELEFLEDFSVQARDLVLAPGTLDQNGNETTGTVFATSGRRIQYSDNIDTVGGQSGSPVWHTFEEDDPRVLAVHSRGGGFRNAGTLIDTEAYNLIMTRIEGNGDPNELPENLIIGSDPVSRPIPLPDLPGDDLIEGTYRKERILGLTGDDTISGAGADDRLEGNEGDDQLNGGSGDDIIIGGPGIDLIDGGTNFLDVINPFNRENDIAVFSAPRSEYDIEIDTIGAVLGLPTGEETVTTVTHLNDGIDGIDVLTNIEILVFSDGAVPVSSDDDVLDGLLNFLGGSEDDNIVGNVLGNLIRGEAGNDRLEGDDGDDILKGHSGNDSLYGGNDDDLLQGGNNNDCLFGGAGEDRLFGSQGSDRFEGGDGNDTLSGGGGFGWDTLKGQGGEDTITGGGGKDLLQGGDDKDTLNGNGGDDRLFGDAGNDLIFGQTGNDYLSGGENADTLKGETGNNYLTGENGNDLLQGGDGNDELNGDGGKDRLFANSGNDLLNGGNNHDYLAAGDGDDTLEGDFGRDTLIGGNDDDELNGEAGNDRLFGQNGNDTLIGDKGSDYMQGNLNDDILKGGSDNDTLIGGGGNDLLQGGEGSDLLYGQSGDDEMYGESGNDVLFGGSGQNIISGGDGADKFVFTDDGQSLGRITDFSVEDDTLVFNTTNFAGISTQGMISSDMLTIGTDASSSSHRFIYNSGTGNLFYDSDGSGSSQQVKLVGLDTGLALTNSDFEMI